MKKRLTKRMAVILCGILVGTGFPTGLTVQAQESEAQIHLEKNGAGELKLDQTGAKPGEQVTVTADAADSSYLAQIRMGVKKTDGSTSFQTLSCPGTDTAVSTSFVLPEGDVTVYADFIPKAWDGTIDFSWYDGEKSDYTISYAAQLAGASALINGLFNDIPVRSVTDDGKVVQIPELTGTEGKKVELAEVEKVNEGFVSSADGSGYQIFKDLDGDGFATAVAGDLKKLAIHSTKLKSSGSNMVYTTDSYWYGCEDFAGKTLTLDQDLDMGASCSGLKTVLASWKGPNFMPVGGGYCMDVNNGYTKLGIGFAGTLNGAGHMITNLYINRHVGTGEFGNCQFCGLVGLLGTYDSKADPADHPTVENLAVDGFVYGNRMVGGLVGEVTHSRGALIQNCINFATVYNTDAKGCAGIVGNASYTIGNKDTQPAINNCVNFGYICTGYNKNAGGLIGKSEAYLSNSYTTGYVGHDGNGEAEAANSIGANDGGAIWYNAYALPGASWFEETDKYTPKTEPGVKTPEVWGMTEGSAIYVMESPEAMRSVDFCGMLNGKVRISEIDANGYLKSQDALIKNVRRDWVPAAETDASHFVSSHMAQALASVISWHDPQTDLKTTRQETVATELKALNAAGMPIPSCFMTNLPAVTGIVSSGMPVLSYLAGETFDTNNHDNPSVSPESDKTHEYSLWALFEDGTYSEITDYQVLYPEGRNEFAQGDTTVTVKASCRGQSFEESFNVTVKANELLSMEITAQPIGLLYAKGDHFSPDGMTITTMYGEEGAPAMGIKATWKNGELTVSRSMQKQQVYNEETKQYEVTGFLNYQALTEEAAKAYQYGFSPAIESALTGEIQKVTVSHAFAGKTMQVEIPVQILSIDAPFIKKDSYDNWTVSITNEEEFLWFVNQVNTVKSDMHAELMSDLSISDETFAPIGQNGKKTVMYGGNFHGNGHSITMHVSRPDQAASLFYYIGETGTVTDLTVKGSLSGGKGAAGIAISCEGTIENCFNQAEIHADGKTDCAGVAADLRGDGKLVSCSNQGAVSGAYLAGGLAAEIKDGAGITDSENTGAIHLASGYTDAAAGGLAALVRDASVMTSCNRAEVTGTGSLYAGGLVGRIYTGSYSPKIENCYNRGSVKLEEAESSAVAGGLIGTVGANGTNLKITSCYTTGAVEVLPVNTGVFGGVMGSLTKALTDKKWENIKQNMALAGTAELLVGAISSDVKPTDSNFAWSDEEPLKASSCSLGEAFWPDHESNDGWPVLTWEHAAIHHTLTKVAAKAATTATEGNIEYYVCEICKDRGGLFADANAAKQLSLADTVIPVLKETKSDSGKDTASDSSGQNTGAGSTKTNTTTSASDQKAANTSTTTGNTAQTTVKKPASIKDAVKTPLNKKLATVKQIQIKKAKKKLSIQFTGVKGATDYCLAYRKAGAAKWSYRFTGGKTKIVLTVAEKGLYECRLAVFVKKNSVWSKSSWSALQRIYTYVAVPKYKAAKKKVTVKIARDKTANGYVILYSTKANMKNAKKITLKSNKKTSAVVKKLKKKTNYYFQVYAFKKKSGKVYNGPVSAVKKVKTK